MKKKLSILLVLVLAVAISAYSVGGTYAKYTSNATTSGTVNVAKWAIAFKNGNDTTLTNTFDLASTVVDTVDGNADGQVLASRIAPGTKGSFNLKVDGTGTEVAYTYAVSFTVADAPANLKFYSNAEMTTEITATDSVYTAAGSTTVAVNAESKISEIPVYWKWVYETLDAQSSSVAGDTADTTRGGNGGSDGTPMVVTATITATQAD